MPLLSRAPESPQAKMVKDISQHEQKTDDCSKWTIWKKKKMSLLPADTTAQQGKWLVKRSQGWASVPTYPLNLVGAL